VGRLKERYDKYVAEADSLTLLEKEVRKQKLGNDFIRHGKEILAILEAHTA
jgi:hypothetical protein